jgi:hypothetical protein
VKKEKILLVLLPFWTPQIPPMGIACLKSYLQPKGYDVKTVDVNIDDELRKLYNRYFDCLREYISREKRGNFYNIGHEVLQNHIMAHLNYKNESEYMELVKVLIYKTFFFHAGDSQVRRLNNVVDAFYTWLENYFTSLLEKEKPDVLGLSVYKGTVPASMFAFKLTRERFPHIKTVMGGAVFAQNLVVGTPDFEYFLEKTTDYIDKIIVGEGEVLFLKLLQNELPVSRRVFTRDDIGGEALDLEAVDIPGFSDLDISKYPAMAAYSSRSCPFQCSFCTETVYWGKYRKKSAPRIVDELTQLFAAYRRQVFIMCDSLLNPVITDLAEEFIKRDISLYWDGYLRVDKHTRNIDRVLLWRKGGFYRARLGIETGSQRVLDLMNKQVGIDQIKSAVAALANAGIKTTTYWIIGYPGETEHDFQQTLDLIEEIKDDIYEAECNPFGYYLSGQVDSDEWAQKNKSIPLYPVEARDMLILQTWTLDCGPSREETYRRIARFVRHCSKLGIPNPYSLYDIHNADDRWKKLHRNAVPSLIEFNENDAYIEESRNVKKLSYLRNILQDDGEFGF